MTPTGNCYLSILIPLQFNKNLKKTLENSFLRHKSPAKKIRKMFMGNKYGKISWCYIVDWSSFSDDTNRKLLLEQSDSRPRDRPRDPTGNYHSTIFCLLLCILWGHWATKMLQQLTTREYKKDPKTNMRERL